MSKELAVFLHDQYAGNLRSDQAQLSFVYDAKYLIAPNARPISANMPLRAESYPHQTVYPFFSGLLPDEGVRYRLARYLQLSEKNIFGLLEAIGGECAGAISVKVCNEKIDLRPQYLILNDAEAVEIMHSLQQRPFLVGQDEIRISAAGAQSKLMICFIDKKIAIPKGHTPSTHLIKPGIAGLDSTVQNEYFCMLLAHRIGLRTPQVNILTLLGEDFYVIERYDRTIINDQVQRLHQEDFCQILNIPPEIKYENEGGPTLPDCFNVLENFISKGNMPGIDKLRLLKLVFFNYIIGNTDAHGKNFSILYSDQGATLAPCYDLLSTFVYANELNNKMAMKIGGEYNNTFIQRKNWEKLAISIGVKEQFLIQQLKTTAAITLKASELLIGTLDKPSVIYAKIHKVIEQQVAKIRNI